MYHQPRRRFADGVVTRNFPVFPPVIISQDIRVLLIIERRRRCFARRVILGENNKIDDKLCLLTSTKSGVREGQGNIEGKGGDYFDVTMVGLTTAAAIWWEGRVCRGEGDARC